MTAKKEDSKPKSINVMGVNYELEYVDNMIDADIDRRHELLGQIDYITRTIRLYTKNEKKTKGDGYTFHLVMHEMLHAIAVNAGITPLMGDDGERYIDIMGTVLADSLVRNGMVSTKWENL